MAHLNIGPAGILDPPPIASVFPNPLFTPSTAVSTVAAHVIVNTPTVPHPAWHELSPRADTRAVLSAYQPHNSEPAYAALPRHDSGLAPALAWVDVSGPFRLRDPDLTPTSCGRGQDHYGSTP